MTYLYRAYKGNLQYINLVKIVKKVRSGYEYEIIKQLYYSDNMFKYSVGGMGSALDSSFTDEWGLIKVIFTEVY